MNKILNWIIKIAGLVVTMPVTWLVAGDLFHDIGLLPLRYTVQLSAVLLVEGVFLSNWLLLENADNRTPLEVKVRYALTALGLYLGLWVLAFVHGEGAAGIVFRIALGAALIGSGWDTYINTVEYFKSRVERDVDNSRKVRRVKRKLEQNYRAYVLQEEDTTRRLGKQLSEALERRELKLKARQEFDRKEKEHTVKLESIERDIEEERRLATLPKRTVRTSSTNASDRDTRIAKSIAYVTDNPELPATECVEWMQEEFNIAESTAWKYWKYVKPELATVNSNGKVH